MDGGNPPGLFNWMEGQATAAGYQHQVQAQARPQRMLPLLSQGQATGIWVWTARSHL